MKENQSSLDIAPNFPVSALINTGSNPKLLQPGLGKGKKKPAQKKPATKKKVK